MNRQKQNETKQKKQEEKKQEEKKQWTSAKNKSNSTTLKIGFAFLAIFVLWTGAIQLIDVQAIGPKGSAVGFAALNGCFHQLTGVHMWLYTVTDWLGLVPLFFACGFALLGLVQLIQRRSLFKVDATILLLGGFYLVVIAAYLFFEIVAINYRPILINGYLEASYPSSTTMLAMCVMPTAVLQLNDRIDNQRFKQWVSCMLIAFTVFMVVGRLISGVHWLSDIVGGILLSAGLVLLYDGLVGCLCSEVAEKEEEQRDGTDTANHISVRP